MGWLDTIADWLHWLLDPRTQPGTLPPKTEPAPPKPTVPAPPAPLAAVGRRPWTFMVYMAGDNGRIFDTQFGKVKLMEEMTSVGFKDLAKMASTGTTDHVAVTCLFDTPSATYRVEVRRGSGWADSVVQRLPAVNSGDPKTLSLFIRESVRAYPADRYALVFWNHGTGWLDTDAYASVRQSGGEAPSSMPAGRPAIFRTTVEAMAGAGTRPIAYDDSSKDFLDSRDLDAALAEARTATGVRLDLIGMDACLMAMIEGWRQLAPHADYFVASQEVEPMAGWPYGPILTELDSPPVLTPEQLALAIVEAFAASFGGVTRREDDTITQSALLLARTAETERLCKALVAAILAQRSAGLRALLRKVVSESLVFEDANYRDLGDFAARLAEAAYWGRIGPVHGAASDLAAHLADRGGSSPVLRVGFLAKYKRATGLSVFLPPILTSETTLKQMLARYRHLRFAQATGWDRLLEWLFASF